MKKKLHILYFTFKQCTLLHSPQNLSTTLCWQSVPCKFIFNFMSFKVIYAHSLTMALRVINAIAWILVREQFELESKTLFIIFYAINSIQATSKIFSSVRNYSRVESKLFKYSSFFSSLICVCSRPISSSCLLLQNIIIYIAIIPI